jgi:hypothetical protein
MVVAVDQDLPHPILSLSLPLKPGRFVIPVQVESLVALNSEIVYISLVSTNAVKLL